MGYNNNYTRNVNFKHAHLNPKYMQILKNLIDHPEGQMRTDVLLQTHGECLGRTWNAGPFTLLHENGYAAFKRIGHKCFWFATSKGIQFYYDMKIKHDLLKTKAA